MSINAESVQHLDPLKYLLDLPRRVLGWCRPEPALQGGAAVVRLRDRGAPLGEQQRIEGVMNAAGERRLVASDRLGDHRAQIPLAQHDQLMLVQPATCKLQQSLPIGGARELIAKDPHECATSWFAEPVKSQRLTGEPLVLKQRPPASVHRTQRSQIGSGGGKLLTEVPPEHRWHDPQGIQEPPAHAQKADL